MSQLNKYIKIHFRIKLFYSFDFLNSKEVTKNTSKYIRDHYKKIIKLTGV